jgi:CheY-like chemotaxis protein
MVNGNNRRQKRSLIKKNVRINGKINASAIDISEGGMYIYTSESFPKGSLIDTELSLRDGESPLRVKAKVQHIHEGIGFGVMFCGLGPQERKKLKEFIYKIEGKPFETEKLHMKKILLIDDSDTARSMYKSSLLMEGFFVIEASSGMEGIKRLREVIPELIVLDLIMEDMDGYKFLQIVRVNPEWENIPVLVLTGRMTTAEMDRAASLGINDYLVKATTSPKKLAEKVKGVLEKVSK